MPPLYLRGTNNEYLLALHGDRYISNRIPSDTLSCNYYLSVAIVKVAITATSVSVCINIDMRDTRQLYLILNYVDGYAILETKYSLRWFSKIARISFVHFRFSFGEIDVETREDF